jgi:hypothetical protein
VWTLVADASVLDWYPYGESSLLPVFKMTGVLHVGKHRLLHASLQLLVVAASSHGTQRNTAVCLQLRAGACAT